MKTLLLLIVFTVVFSVTNAAPILSTTAPPDPPAGADESYKELAPPMEIINMSEQWQQPDTTRPPKEPRTFFTLLPLLFPDYFGF